MKILVMFFIFSHYALCDQFINSYEGKKKTVIKNCSILKLDSSLNEDDIFKGLHDDKFKSYNNRDLYLDSKNYEKDSVYYLKIFIKNNTQKNHLELYGFFGPIASKRIQCIFFNENILQKVVFSTKLDNSDNINLLNYGYATIYIDPGETKKIYIRLDRPSIPQRTNIYITELNEIIQHEYNYSKITSFLVGLTFLLSIMALILYIRFKNIYFLSYSIICLSTYFKSKLFMDYLRYLNLVYINELYCIFAILYIFSLVEFVKEVLKLKNKYKTASVTLDNIKYLSTLLILFNFLGIIDSRNTAVIRIFLIFILITTATYVSYFKYREGEKIYFYSFLPKLIYFSNYTFPLFSNIILFIYDIRILNQLDLLANIVLIGGILFYELKELLRTRTKLEESETVIATINNSDNLMHSMQNIIELYKNDIKYSKIMFFHRIIVYEGEEEFYELRYSFSIPSINDEILEAKKYNHLEKFLNDDKFKTHHICNDIKNSDLYSKLLKGYKSMIALRLSALDKLDLGYVLILNENKIDYDYNNIMKDFRYKVTLVVQHFSTKEDERRKSGSAARIKAEIQSWLLTLQEGVLSAKYSKEDIEMLKKLIPRALGAEKQINKAIEKTIESLDKNIDTLNSSLNFKANNKIYNTKSTFKYTWMKERMKYSQESMGRLHNCNLEVISDVEDSQEFYCQLKVLESILMYFLSYLRSKVEGTNNDLKIILNLKIENYKLVISASVEGLDLDELELEKEYRSDVQARLLEELQSKSELKVEDGRVIIKYYLNILALEDRKDKHLHYTEYREDNEEDDDENEDEEDNDEYIDRDYDDEQAERDKGVEAVFKKLQNTTIHDDIYKD